MKYDFGLLKEITDSFHISKGFEENETAWKARAIYSYLGQVGYSSLWDIQDELRPSSIIHFKGRIIEALLAITKIYPEVGHLFDSPDELADEIYDEMLQAGAIYHEPNRIMPPVKTTADCNPVYLHRGHELQEKCSVSGVGRYADRVTDSNTCTLFRMYQIDAMDLKASWKQSVRGLKWSSPPNLDRFEFLKTVPPFRSGYWINNYDTNEITLARVGEKGNHLYYFYKEDESGPKVSPIPFWKTEGYEYRNIAVACLAINNRLPSCQYHLDGEVTEIRLGYLYPPEEMTFLRLYSWPKRYSGFPQNFQRVLSTKVFLAMKKEFEKKGYSFEEV